MGDCGKNPGEMRDSGRGGGSAGAGAAGKAGPHWGKGQWLGQPARCSPPDAHPHSGRHGPWLLSALGTHTWGSHVPNAPETMISGEGGQEAAPMAPRYRELPQSRPPAPPPDTRAPRSSTHDDKAMGTAAGSHLGRTLLTARAFWFPDCGRSLILSEGPGGEQPHLDIQPRTAGLTGQLHLPGSRAVGETSRLGGCRPRHVITSDWMMALPEMAKSPEPWEGGRGRWPEEAIRRGALTSERVHDHLQHPQDFLAQQREVVLREECGQVLPLQTVAQAIGQAHHLGEKCLLEQGEGWPCLLPTLPLHHSGHPAHAQEPGQQLRHLHQTEAGAEPRAGVNSLAS